jgi:hypothetical protein
VVTEAVNKIKLVIICLFSSILSLSSSFNTCSTSCSLATALYGTPTPIGAPKGIGKFKTILLLVFIKAAMAVRAAAIAVFKVICLNIWFSCLTTLFLRSVLVFKIEAEGHIFWFLSLNLVIPKANNNSIAKGSNRVWIVLILFSICCFLKTKTFSLGAKRTSLTSLYVG